MSFYREDPAAKKRPSHPVVRLVRFIWGAIKGYFFFVGLMCTLIPLLLFVWMARSSEGLSKLDRKKAGSALKANGHYVVEIDLEGPIQVTDDQDPRSLFKKLFRGERQVSLPTVSTTMRRAAKDPRVMGLLLHVKDVRGDIYAFDALRDAFDKVKAAKKPIYVTADSFDSDAYLLGSVGQHITLTPAGSMNLLGPVIQTMYFKGALDKLGVEMIAVKAGKYKSALESFVADGPSPATVEMYTTMESSLRKHMVDKISEGRGKAPDLVAGWFKRSMYTAPEALAQGMVDRLAYEQDATTFALEQMKSDKALTLEDYASESQDMDDKIAANGNDQIAYIQANGEIVDTSDDTDYDVITPKRLIKELNWATSDNDIKSVVLHVNSPGGSALASDLIADEVRKLAKKKPVIISMGSVAASGGYYISAPATKIIADPGTITGSIGVIAAIPKATNVSQKWGVNFHVITQTAREALLNPAKAPSAEDREILAAHIEWTYQAFLKVVSEGRHMEVPKVHELAQGRVYTGMQAKDLGLVDDLGGLTQAFREAKTAAQLDPEKLYSIATYQGEDMTLLECVRSQKAMRRCFQQFGSLQTALNPMSSFTDEEGLLAQLSSHTRLLLRDPTSNLAQIGKPLAWWPQGSLQH